MQKVHLNPEPILASAGFACRAHLWRVVWLGTVLWLPWSLHLGAELEQRYDYLISARHQHGMESALIKAVIKFESGFDPLAGSWRGGLASGVHSASQLACSGPASGSLFGL
ncbi:hypothetical protein NKDENANG_01965 [Candidatus Entotheonellaceae bacterium PAL068K]